MLECPRCHGRTIETVSLVPPGHRICQTCSFNGTDATFHTVSHAQMRRAEKELMHAAHWSRRHSRRSPVLNKMEELVVGIASLLLGALSTAVFPFPLAVPVVVWALTISAFVFLVLFVAAHIWKAHAQDPMVGNDKIRLLKDSVNPRRNPKVARTKKGKKKKNRR